MWIEDLSNGGFKYFERYKSPSTKKWKRESGTLDKKYHGLKKLHKLNYQRRLSMHFQLIQRQTCYLQRL